MLPCQCPSCRAQLKVRSLRCESCETEVTGLYDLPLLARLEADDQSFILQFVRSSGSLKEMARHLGLSYPTVRNRLDDVIGRIEAAQSHTQKQ